MNSEVPVHTMEEGILLGLLNWLTGMSSVSGYSRKLRIAGTRSRGKSGQHRKKPKLNQILSS